MIRANKNPAPVSAGKRDARDKKFTRLLYHNRKGMSSMNRKKCINCGISNVPLMLGIDGNLHCADHIGMLIMPKKEESKIKQEDKKHE